MSYHIGRGITFYHPAFKTDPDLFCISREARSGPDNGDGLHCAAAGLEKRRDFVLYHDQSCDRHFVKFDRGYAHVFIDQVILQNYVAIAEITAFQHRDQTCWVMIFRADVLQGPGSFL